MLAAVVCLAVMLAGCGSVQLKSSKVKELAYTVADEEELPKAVSQKIAELKEEPFELSCEEGEYLYIARGYGRKETGGYSIRVEDLYLSENAVCCKMQLAGPTQEEAQIKGASFPYIVVKTEARREPVLFE